MGGRKTHVGSRTRVLRIRYKDVSGIKSRLFLNISQCPPSVPGRILRVNKVSREEAWKVGEFNMMPKLLMREFRNKAKKPAFDEKMAQVEKELHMVMETETKQI
jgi:hypothetical protein